MSPSWVIIKHGGSDFSPIMEKFEFVTKVVLRRESL